MTTTEKRSGLTTNIFAIVGFIIIIALGIWGAVSAVRFAPSIFSSVSSLVATIDTEIDIEMLGASNPSGEPVSIAWTHNATDTGAYAFSYRCRPGFHFEIPLTDGEYSALSCETPYSMPVSARTLRVIPVSEENRFLDVPFVIVYMADGEIAAQGSGLMTVVNDEINSSPSTIPSDSTNLDKDASEESNPVTTPRTPATTPDTSTSVVYVPQPVSNPNGIADLQVRILAMGVLNGGTINQQTYMSQQDIAAVRFEVQNVGTKTSGAWSFVANLPTTPSYQYTADTQSALNPGDRIEYTLQFDRLSPGSRAFSVQVNPTSAFPEIRVDNNVASRTVVVQ